MIVVFGKVVLILILSTAAPVQGAERPDFLSAEVVANAMASEPSAASHTDAGSWGASSVLLVTVPSPFIFPCT